MLCMIWSLVWQSNFITWYIYCCVELNKMWHSRLRIRTTYISLWYWKLSLPKRCDRRKHINYGFLFNFNLLHSFKFTTADLFWKLRTRMMMKIRLIVKIQTKRMILKFCQLGRGWRRYYSCECFGDIRKVVTLYNDHLSNSTWKISRYRLGRWWLYMWRGRERKRIMIIYVWSWGNGREHRHQRACEFVNFFSRVETQVDKEIQKLQVEKM